MTTRDDVWDATVFLLVRAGETRVRAVLARVLSDRVRAGDADREGLAAAGVATDFLDRLDPDPDPDPTAVRLRYRSRFEGDAAPRTWNLTAAPGLPSPTTVRRVLGRLTDQGRLAAVGGGRDPTVWRLTSAGMNYFNIAERTRVELLLGRLADGVHRTDRELLWLLDDRGADALPHADEADLALVRDRLAARAAVD